jgi:hypothetical protein
MARSTRSSSAQKSSAASAVAAASSSASSRSTRRSSRASASAKDAASAESASAKDAAASNDGGPSATSDGMNDPRGGVKFGAASALPDDDPYAAGLVGGSGAGLGATDEYVTELADDEEEDDDDDQIAEETIDAGRIGTETAHPSSRAASGRMVRAAYNRRQARSTCKVCCPLCTLSLTPCCSLLI